MDSIDAATVTVNDGLTWFFNLSVVGLLPENKPSNPVDAFLGSLNMGTRWVSSWAW